MNLIKDADGYVETASSMVVRPLLAPTNPLCPCQPKVMDELARMYLRFKPEGVLPLLYSQEEPDIANFMLQFMSIGSLTLGAFLRTGSLNQDGEGSDELTGYVHLEKPESIGGGFSRSTIHFAFFRDYQDGAWTRLAAKIMLEWTFDRTQLDLVLGYTAAPNRAMRKFARSLGFYQSVLPGYTTQGGKQVDCIVSSMTREMWEQVNARKMPISSLESLL